MKIYILVTLASLLLLTLLLSQAHATTLTATPNPYTMSNKTIDVGFISIANTVISNGAGTYTGNWLWTAPNGNALTLSNTLIQNLPASLYLSLTINAVSYNSLLLTFNGVSYYANAIYPNSIYGTWTFNAFVTDTNGDTSPSPALTNTITMAPAFSATWNTLATGGTGSGSTSIVLPITGNYVVSWGDGTYSISPTTTHTYGSGGIYTINIISNANNGITGFSFNNGGDKLKIDRKSVV